MCFFHNTSKRKGSINNPTTLVVFDAIKIIFSVIEALERMIGRRFFFHIFPKDQSIII